MVRFLLVAVTMLYAAPAWAYDRYYCHRLIETTFKGDLVPHCRPGDTLVLQITANVAPGTVVGQLCDLDSEIWTETRDNQATVVCRYIEKKKRVPQ